MSDMPERMLAWPSNHNYQRVSLAGGRPNDAVEYVRADRAEAALAAQIEVDAEICTYIIKNYECMKADKETYQPMWVQKVAKGMVSLARQDIRNQPHDRTALDRMLAEAREKALRDATEILDDEGWLGMSKHRILALIEKPQSGEFATNQSNGLATLQKEKTK